MQAPSSVAPSQDRFSCFTTCCNTCTEIVDQGPTRLAEVGCFGSIGCAVASGLGWHTFLPVAFAANTFVHCISRWKLNNNHSTERLITTVATASTAQTAATAVINQLGSEREEEAKRAQQVLTEIKDEAKKESLLQDELKPLLERVRNMKIADDEEMVYISELKGVAQEMSKFTNIESASREQLTMLGQVFNLLSEKMGLFIEASQKTKDASKELGKQNALLASQLADYQRNKDKDIGSSAAKVVDRMEHDVHQEQHNLDRLALLLSEAEKAVPPQNKKDQ